MRLLLLLILCLLCCPALYSQSCTDSAYKLRFSAPDSLYTTHHITTADGGTLVLAEVFAYPLKKALLFRLDKGGKLLWSRTLADDAGRMLQPARVLEQSDGSITVAGINRAMRTGPEKIFLAKLDPAGRLLWQQLYAPAHNNNNPLVLQALTEGEGGDLLLGWTRAGINNYVGEDGQSIVVLRVRATGTVVWSKSFATGTLGTVNLSGVFMCNGTVMVAGYVLDSRRSCTPYAAGAFILMQLSYASGAVAGQQVHCFQHGGSGFGFGTSDINFSSTLLRDGSLALYGTFTRNNDSLHFYKVLFNSSGMPYHYRVYGTRAQGYMGRIQVLPSGTTGMVMIDDKRGLAYRATIDADETMRRQRKHSFSSAAPVMDHFYHNSAPYFSYRWAERNDGGFSVAHNSSNATRPAIEFSRLTADTDTLACLGTDEAFIHSFPFVLSPSDWTWEKVADDTHLAAPLSLGAATYPLREETVCKEINTCTTLQVNGPGSLCAREEETLYTALQNAGCHQRVVWTVAPATPGIVAMPRSDSTVALRFTAPVSAPLRLELIASLENCPAIRDTIKLTVLPALQPLPADTVLCEGATLDLNPGAGLGSYRWQDGSTDPVYTVTTSGTYWVEVSAPAGCRRSDTVTVTVAPLPAAFLSDTVMCASLPITLRPAGRFNAYQWSDGSAGATLEVTSEGRYTLRVRDAHGCSGEDEALVEEKPCPQLVYFPTAFTPNGDGRNDTYRPTLLSPLLYYRFTIYNRWGHPVFSTSEPGQGWDGRLRSKRQPTGLFTWVCTYQFPGASRTVAKGSLLLVN